jgi:hypothetical protein
MIIWGKSKEEDYRFIQAGHRMKELKYFPLIAVINAGR